MGGRRRRWAVAVAAAALVLVGGACSRSGAGSEAPMAHAADLQGTYRAPSGPNVLEFKGSSWTLTTGPRVFSGTFVVAGSEIVFLLTYANHPAYDHFCRTDLDVYTWSLAGGGLTLRPVFTTAADRVGGRPCNTVADQVFRNGVWARQG